MSEGGGVSLPGWIPTSAPWWWYDAGKVIGGIVGLSAGGIAFLDDPIGFVRAAIAKWIVGGILGLFAKLGGLVVLVGEQIIGSLRTAGREAADALGVLTLPLEVLLNTLETVLRVAVVNAGPAAPLVWVVAWVGAVVLGAVLVRATIEVVRFI